MKDINGICPVSVKQQRSLARWYRNTKIFVLLYIMGITLCHGIQLYTWHVASCMVCAPMCLSDAHSITAQCAVNNEHLALIQAYCDYMHRLELSQNWYGRLQGIQNSISHIESIEMTEQHMTCIMICDSVETCMNVVHSLSTQEAIESALCTSIKPSTKNTALLMCTIQCRYAKAIHCT